MRRTTIESIVNRLEAELGPDANVNEIENAAISKLSALSNGSALSVAPIPSGGKTVLLDVPVHVRIDDCSGRLASTVIAHAYDKIRRVASGLPSLFSDVLSNQSLVVPAFSLEVHGTEHLIQTFSAADAVEICISIERAALDCGFKRVRILSLRSGKGNSAPSLLPLVPTILRACSTAHVEIEIGSSEVGLRAQEVHDTASVLLEDLPDPDSQARVILACNTPVSSTVFQHQKSDARIDLHISAWPEIEATYGNPAEDLCYRDRAEALEKAGMTTWTKGGQILDSLSRDLPGKPEFDGRGRVCVSVDDPDSGPWPAGRWTGLPVTFIADGATASPAASLLRRGLLRGCPGADAGDIFSDGLPLCDSLRNIVGFDHRLRSAELAGFIVETFTQSILTNRPRWMRMVGLEDPRSDTNIRIAGIPGEIPLAKPASEWIKEQFDRGGAMVPPMRNPTW